MFEAVLILSLASQPKPLVVKIPNLSLNECLSNVKEFMAKHAPKGENIQWRIGSCGEPPKDKGEAS